MSETNGVGGVPAGPEAGSGPRVSRRGVLGLGAAALAATAVGATACDSSPADAHTYAEVTEPSDHIVAQHRQAAQTLPLSDTADLADADRGRIAGLDPGVVRDATGKVVWDNDSYAFLREPCPPSVHPSLWRQSGLVSKQGLYEVVPGIYQVRGLDLSNMTLVEGTTGVVVIDPLICRETAVAALALYRAHRGDRPVTGLVYTHPHVDHFGGALGVTTPDDVRAGRCPVLAPAGFLEHAVAENVYAGPAMARRSAYMYGAALDRGPRGQVGSGLGQTTSTGAIGLIPPTRDITHTGQEETIDGVHMVFQMTPGTEAPAEMNFYFPAHRALCTAENATHTMHNLLTLRGAPVRDPRMWAAYLTEAINLFGGSAEVAFASHHWPTWGADRVVEFLALQRDLYAYLHDQTLRLINQGYVGSEIAEMLQLPPALRDAWHTRGYYGSVSHNVKAVYQRYMGWFDGNPAHLWEHPPAESATRHVAAMGGADEVLKKGRRAYARRLVRAHQGDAARGAAGGPGCRRGGPGREYRCHREPRDTGAVEGIARHPGPELPHRHTLIRWWPGARATSEHPPVRSSDGAACPTPRVARRARRQLRVARQPGSAVAGAGGYSPDRVVHGRGERGSGRLTARAAGVRTARRWAARRARGATGRYFLDVCPRLGQ